MSKVESKLGSLGYRNLKHNLWIKGKKSVQIVHSSESKGSYFRIVWKEKWKGYDIIIFDYSVGDGPTCIMPIDVLLQSPFVTEKRKQDSYVNSGNWWSQRFPIYHDLTQLVLSYKNRWNLL